MTKSICQALHGAALCAMLSGAGQAEPALAAVLGVSWGADALAYSPDAIIDVLVTPDVTGKPAVSLTLVPDSAAEFTEFTYRHVGEIITIMVCDTVLIKPRLQSGLSGGSILLTIPRGYNADEIAVILKGEDYCPVGGL